MTAVIEVNCGLSSNSSADNGLIMDISLWNSDKITLCTLCLIRALGVMGWWHIYMIGPFLPAFQGKLPTFPPKYYTMYMQSGTLCVHTMYDNQDTCEEPAVTRFDNERLDYRLELLLLMIILCPL